MSIKLRYIGKQEFPGHAPVKLWNIKDSPRPDLHPDGSTVSIEGLREMGVAVFGPLCGTAIPHGTEFVRSKGGVIEWRCQRHGCVPLVEHEDLQGG